MSDGYYQSLATSAIGEDSTNIASVWKAMDNEKGDLVERSIEYARLTIPSICPPVAGETTEQEKGNVMIGARAVGFLANKIVSVMFPNDRPFFRVELSPEVEFELAKEVDQADIDASKITIMEAGTKVTNLAMHKMGMVAYRPVAVQAAKHLIITGNATIRRMPSGKRIEYGVRNIGVRRQIDGTVYDVILRDVSRVDALEKKIQDQLYRTRLSTKPYDVVSLYTRWTKHDPSGKWTVTQAVDEVPLSTFYMVPDADFPLIILTWSLASGENYGRGLVEDEIVAFSAVDVSTTAQIDLFGIAADVKFLVNPGSVIDIVELNEAKRGTYHYGAENDITAPNIGNQKGTDLQVLAGTIAQWERHISTAFLMTSGTVRDAERVTAEEIRFYAQEIEAAFGGLYSVLALGWQQREAEYAIKKVNASIPKTLVVKITTGADALSDEAALQNLAYSLNDLALLNGVPEDVRAGLSTERIAKFIFMKRNLSLAQFTLSREEIEQRNAQAQKIQQAAVDQETDAEVTKESAKAAMRG